MVKLIDETQRISVCKHLKKLQYKFCKMLGSFNYSMDSMFVCIFIFNNFRLFFYMPNQRLNFICITLALTWFGVLEP